MTLNCVDASNYSGALSADQVAGLKGAGVVLGIVQAVDPPAGYPTGVTRQQIQALLDGGITVDAYVWLWFDLDASDIVRKLDLLSGLLIRRIWLDVEDIAAAKYDQATCEAKVASALVLCDQRSLQGPTGVYTGRWFWTDRRYMADTTTFGERALWDSDYDDVDDTGGFTPYGGWAARAIKQYHGTTTLAGVPNVDLNALSADELARVQGGDVTDPERQAMQATIDGLVSAIGYIAGDLLAPVAPQKTSTKAVQRLVAGIRSQADQHGISHA